MVVGQKAEGCPRRGQGHDPGPFAQGQEGEGLEVGGHGRVGPMVSLGDDDGQRLVVVPDRDAQRPGEVLGVGREDLATAQGGEEVLQAALVLGGACVRQSR
ncbi:MAG: hypothetical protein WKF43_16935 [Acidimicrobiales bacterium]